MKIVNINIVDIDFKSLEAECFIFNGPLYKSEHRSDFETLINSIKGDNVLPTSEKVFKEKFFILESKTPPPLIKRCKEKWCKITTGGYGGWIFKSSLWGKIK